MIPIVEGDIFNSGATLICHQVNCQGVMGSGVALQVKQKYPHIYRAYRKCCNIPFDTSELLGTILTVSVNPEFTGMPGSIADGRCQYIVNLFAQDNYGLDKRHTNYGALARCLENVRQLTCTKNNLGGASIAIPYRMSSDRGGGEWNIVDRLIDDILIDCDVTYYAYNGGE